MHALIRKVKQAVEDGKSVAVVAYCRRNRHRSVALGWLVSSALEFLKISCSLTHANARASWSQMSGGCRGRCDCQHVNMDAKTEAEDHAGRLCDLARFEMSERDMRVLDDCCEVRGVGLASAPKAAPTAPAPRAPVAKAARPGPPAPPAPLRAASTGSTPRSPAEARAVPPPKTPPMRRPSPRRSRSAPRDAPQTEALIARISELTSVVTQLVAERDQARASGSSSYRRRPRSRSDSRDSRLTTAR